MSECKRKTRPTNSIIKFEKTLKPRFLPGEVFEVERQADFLCYKGHRLRCARATKKVDDGPPRLDPEVYYKSLCIRDDIWGAMARCRDNLSFMRNINAVWRTGGKVDCWKKEVKSNLVDRRALAIIASKRIRKENKVLHKRLGEYKSELSPEVMAKYWKFMKQAIIDKQRYPWFESISYYPSISSGINLPGPPSRNHCFIDLELADSGLPLGRLVIELYTEYAPARCANFEALCRGVDGVSYKGTWFRRILADYYCQGGNVTAGCNDPEDPEQEDTTTPDEKPTLRHACPGVLTACSDVGLRIGFCLTFRPLHSLDGKYIVFGKVVKGLHNLLKLNAYGTKFGKPLQKVVISNCGVVTPKGSIAKQSSCRSQSSC